MIPVTPLPKQPGIFISYWNVGVLLHFSTLLFVLESLFYWFKLKGAYESGSMLFCVFWFGCLLFAFSHIFLVIMDGWSRFQNYKKIKDYLFMHGFTRKIARPYTGSKSQRSAFLVAAKELGIQDQVIGYYQSLGIRWYHFVPQFMLDDPLFLFRRSFVSRTFLEKYYEPKYNFRQMHLNAISDAAGK